MSTHYDPNTIQHAAMVSALCKSGVLIKEEMTAQDAHLMHMAMGVSGESGEILDAIKKVVIYQKDVDFDNLIEELGDIEFYLEGLRQGLNITREETIEANIAKLGKRYPGFQYSNNAAQARADKA